MAIDDRLSEKYNVHHGFHEAGTSAASTADKAETPLQSALLSLQTVVAAATTAPAQVPRRVTLRKLYH